MSRAIAIMMPATGQAEAARQQYRRQHDLSAHDTLLERSRGGDIAWNLGNRGIQNREQLHTNESRSGPGSTTRRSLAFLVTPKPGPDWPEPLARAGETNIGKAGSESCTPDMGSARPRAEPDPALEIKEKGGASDGARTRDLRRDRPAL